MNPILARTLDALAPKLIGDVLYLGILRRRGSLDENSYYDALTELVLRRVLEPTSVCVDVGCHKGVILQMMLKYAPNGTFHVFEPLPHLCAKLKDDFGQEPNISVYDIALSDKAGESSFNYVISNSGYSGLIKRHYDREDEEDTTITVRTDSLDEVLAGTHVDLLKIDVEGAELQVLRGGKETIKRDRPFIIFEHGLGAADCYGTTPAAVHELLHDDCGLNITLFDSFLRNRRPLSKVEFVEQFEERLNYYFLAYEA